MRLILTVLLAGSAGIAVAQDTPSEPLPELVGGSVRTNVAIAVPVMPGDAVGRQVAEVIATDLRSTGMFTPLGPGGLPGYSIEEAGNPAFPNWRNAGVAALVSGYIESRPDGRMTVACYLHDVTAGRELAHQGFAVASSDWRRAAHKCADLVYSRLSGQQPYLDTRVVYVAETGPKNNRQKRVALMDSDGSNHRYLTVGKNTVVTPPLLSARRQAGLCQLHRPQAARPVVRCRLGPGTAAHSRQPHHLRTAFLPGRA